MPVGLSGSMVIMFFWFVLGVGRTAPDPGSTATLDGVQVPLGKGCNTNIDDTSLLYNEYPYSNISTWFMSWIARSLLDYFDNFLLRHHFNMILFPPFFLRNLLINLCCLQMFKKLAGEAVGYSNIITARGRS